MYLCNLFFVLKISIIPSWSGGTTKVGIVALGLFRRFCATHCRRWSWRELWTPTTKSFRRLSGI